MYSLSANPVPVEEVKNVLRKPTGSIIFSGVKQDFAPYISNKFTILDMVAGAHLFRLIKDENNILKFIHSCPSHETRYTEMSFNKFVNKDQIYIRLVWEQNNIKIQVSIDAQFNSFEEAIGKDAQFELYKDLSGEDVCWEKHSSIHYVSVKSGKSILFQPPAIQAWRSIVFSVKLLFEKASLDNNYFLKLITCNAGITLLVTGLESYTKNRFIELEREGVNFDFEKVCGAFIPSYVIATGEKERILTNSEQQSISVPTIICSRKYINFQSYEDCKKAFRKAYNLSFGKDLTIKNKQLELLQDLILHRHKVIHAFHMEDKIVTNKSKRPGILWANDTSYDIILNTFNDFIIDLHRATLKIYV